MAKIKAKPAPLVINGVEIKKIKLDSWTLEQNEIASPLVFEIYSQMRTSGLYERLQAGEKGDAIELDMAKILIGLRSDAQLLALLYIYTNEKVFDADTYDERVKLFKQTPIKEIGKLKGAFHDFFISIMPSIMAGFQTYSNITG